MVLLKMVDREGTQKIYFADVDITRFCENIEINRRVESVSLIGGEQLPFPGRSEVKITLQLPENEVQFEIETGRISDSTLIRRGGKINIRRRLGDS